MNLRKQGPELKLPEIKVPGFLKDVYYDLKDRHLLPVAVILILATIAVPLALSQSSDSEGSAAREPGTAGASSANGKSAQLVAKSTPGLRDYRRRLGRLQAKDPFVQQYTEAGTNESSTEESGAAEGSTGSSSPSSEFPAPSSPTSPSPETQAPDEPSPDQLAYYSYAIDVRVSAGSSQGNGMGQPTVRHDLPELTMFPSRQAPALVYMGSTKDGKKALMLVSSDVKAIFGDAKCVLGSETCELLAMEPGLPETVVYGGAEKTYKVELRKIHLIKTDQLNRAPLGQPKKSNLHPQPHPHGAG